MADTMLFTRADVIALLPLGTCIAAVEDAFRCLGAGAAEPPRALGVNAEMGVFHVKAGILLRAGRRYFAAKLNANFPDNPSRSGLPTIQGLILLCDANDGRPLAVMDSLEITALRTSAATAVAARLLARRESAVVAIVGCGVQGRAQLRALAEVFSLKRVHAYDADPGRASAYAREMSALLDVPVSVERDIPSAVQHADICVTCTTATDFILHSESVRAGTFVAGVGVDSERKRELAPDLLAHASKVVTDLRAQCAMIGDLHHALESGALALADVHADLGEVVAGSLPGRETDAEIIVFDSTGIGLQDVAAAAALYELALGQREASALRRIAFA